MSALAIEHLGVTLGGAEVLSGVNITVPGGKVIGLLGPSGSGKTTLMRTIVGLQKPKVGDPSGPAYYVLKPTLIALWDEANFPDNPKQAYRL